MSLKEERQLNDAEKAEGSFQISKSTSNQLIHLYRIAKLELIEMVNAYKVRTYDEDIVGVKSQGSVEGISNKLKVETSKGLGGGDFPMRTKSFGNNDREPLKAKSFCTVFFEALDDFMLKVLLVAATGSLIFEYIGADSEDYSHAWFDGAAIYMAVLIVSGFSAFVDWRKEKEFVKRQQQDEDNNNVTVTRMGEDGIPTPMEIHTNHLHCGDILHLKYGMVIPVDGILVSGNQVKTDEAAMTGESDERVKELLEVCLERKAEKGEVDMKKLDKTESHALPSPIMLSGTNVQSGDGKMLCIMVGDNSALGQIMSKLKKKQTDTPLQMKLEIIATEIGKIGTYAALLTIHVLLFRYFLDGLLKRNLDLFGGEVENESRPFATNLKLWVDYIVIGVAVIVVAVPEGLPLAVMISLAYSQGKMLKDNNYVKKLAACEIMGGATNICSDKTGTLTLNQMKVAHMWVGKDVELALEQEELTPAQVKQNEETEKGDDGKLIKKVPIVAKMKPIDPMALFPAHWETVIQAISCNIPPLTDLSATDKSMVDLLERGGVDSETLKQKHNVTDDNDKRIRFPFTSSRKRMSTIIENAGNGTNYNKRLVIKGASELILEGCTHFMDASGQVTPLDDTSRSNITQTITEYAKMALRTIAIAYRDLEPNQNGENHDEPNTAAIKDVETDRLVLISVLGIYDVIRSEVPDAVKTCQKAGVMVRMVTGDNIVTAQAIAEKCGIISKQEIGDDQVCMEGPEFYAAMGGLICKTCSKESPNDCECETQKREERVRNFSKFKPLMAKLKVMARSRPEDKYLLVTGLMQMNQVVAVTGDGTNDAPALSKADVGFGMGITGTAVCKAAADVLIMDDSFTSVVKACRWGRNIYDNIKKFLQFQLTVNVNALIFTVIGAILLKESPLQAIQLLWVNMIMDSLASLALATDLPKDSLLDRPPQNKDDFVVSRKMTKHILWMSIYQMVILFIFLFGGEYMIPESDEKLRFPTWRKKLDIVENDMVFPGRLYQINGDPLYKKVEDADASQGGADGDASRHMTFIFNLFIWLQIVNMVAARKIHDEINLCDGFFENPAFILIWIIIVVVNFLIIQFTGDFFHLHPDGLSLEQHALCIGVSLSVLLFNMFLKLLPDDVAPLLGKDSVDVVRLEQKAAALAMVEVAE